MANEIIKGMGFHHAALKTPDLEKSIAFYEKLGMEKADDVMQYNHIDWTGFTVQ